MNVARTLLTIGVVVASLSLSQCSDTTPVPMPDLDRIDPEVAAKLRQCHAAVVADPTAANWAKYGRTLHAYEMLAEAEAAYLAAAEIAGVSKPAAFDHLQLAGCAAAEWNPERAVEHFTRALALRDDYAATHLDLGILCERLGRFEEATKHYKQMIARWRSSHANLGLGRLALIAGDPKAAIEYMHAALGINANLREAHEALARAHARLGQDKESRASATRAGDLELPTPFQEPLIISVLAERVDAETRFRRAIGFVRSNHAEKAIVELEAVIAARPKHLQARLILADLLHKAARKGDARRHLDFILAENKHQKHALELRARILLDAGDRRAAFRDLKTLLSVDPGNTWAKTQLDKGDGR